MKRKTETNQIVFLRGRRVNLRPPTKDDIPLFLRWFNDEEVRQYIKTFLPLTEPGEIEWLENLHKRQNENLVFVIVEAKHGKPIGTMGLHQINWKDRRAKTGAIIGEKAYWGKGYGSEAKMLLLNYAFNVMNLRKISSGVLSFNARSQAYNKKCGYKVEGILKQHSFQAGAYVDHVLMAVFREDWLPIWKRFQKTGRV